MPTAPDVVLVVRVLPHLGDERMAVDGPEEAVDVDVAPLSREGDVPLGRQVLLAEEDHPVGVKGVADLGELLVIHFRSEVGPEDLRPPPLPKAA